MRSALAERRTAVRVRVPLMLDPDDVAALDSWARDQDIETRTGAVKALIRRATRPERKS